MGGLFASGSLRQEACVRKLASGARRRGRGVDGVPVLLFVFMAVVEDVADAAAGALGDLSGALCGADPGVLGSDAHALADVPGGVDGVQRDQIDGALAGALCDVAGGTAGAFAVVADAGADITTGAAFGLWGWLRLGLRRRRGCGLRSRRLLGAGCAGEAEYKRKSSVERAHGLPSCEGWMRGPEGWLGSGLAGEGWVGTARRGGLRMAKRREPHPNGVSDFA